MVAKSGAEENVATSLSPSQSPGRVASAQSAAAVRRSRLECRWRAKRNSIANPDSHRDENQGLFINRERNTPWQPVVKISKRARLDRSPESIIICTLVRMSMGTRRTRRRQEALWVATTDLPQTVAHPFYRRVNALLDAHGFDAFVERQCQRFYAATRGRPSLTPGIYFRLLRRICGSLPSNLRGSDALVF